MSLVSIVSKSGPLKLGSKGAGVLALQRQLRLAGHELVTDAKFGMITRVAVERFQAAARIAADGLVGPVTAAYLDAVKPIPKSKLPAPLPSVLGISPWLSRARALTGTAEIPGARSNPLILGWSREIAAKWPDLRSDLDWYTNDDVPWCGLAVASFVGLFDPGIKPPRGLLGAISWSDWGTRLKVPVQGCIAVKKRTGGNHVTTIEGVSADGKRLLGRGGNQRNAISLTWYPKGVFFAFRWPPGFPLPAGKLPVLNIEGVTGGSEA